MQESLPAEIQNINSQLHAIDLQIRRLNEQRVGLLRRLNEFQSPMNSLPPEVLSQVFLHYTRNIENCTRGLMTLGAVCIHWRRTTWSSPHLWTDLNLDFIGGGRRNGCENGYISLLDTFYQNTGEIGLNVRIGRRLGWQKRKEVVRDVLAMVLQSYSKKLRSLTVQAAHPSVWTEISNTASNEDVEYPIFEELNLGGEWQHIPGQLQRTFFPNSPKFTHLFIPLISGTPGFGFQLNQFPWSQLTHVSTFWYTQSTQYVIELLSLCPNLVDFRLQAKWVVDSSALRDPTKSIEGPITLQHIQRFSWEIMPSGAWRSVRDTDEIDDTLFKYVRLPVLRELVWGCPISNNALDEAAAFFTCMSGSIQILHCIRPTKYDLQQLWSYFDSLSELHLTERWELSDALKLLTLWSDTDRLLLPQLRNLRLHCDDRRMVDSDRILTLLYSRRHGPIYRAHDRLDSSGADVKPNFTVSRRWEGSWRQLEDFHIQFSRGAGMDCWNTYYEERLKVLVEGAKKVDLGKEVWTIAW